MRIVLSAFLIGQAITAAQPWKSMARGLPISGVGAEALIPDPASPNTLYAISGPGLLFKTTDGSNSWSALSSVTGVTSLLIDPQDSSTLYAGTSHGVLKSTDGGATWRGANAGLPQGSQAWAKVLAIDPTNPSTVYVQKYGDIFKTTDGGQSWIALNAKFYAFQGATFPLANSLTYGPIQTVIVDSRRGSTLYAADLGANAFFKSTDGGTTWYGGDISGLLIDGGTGALALDPETDTLYLGYGSNNGNSYIVTSTDQGTTWTPADGGFSGGIVLNFALDPTMRGTVYARYVQLGNSADPTTRLGFAKTTDSGVNWTTINNGLPVTYPFTSLVAVGNSVLYSTFSNSYNFGAIFQSTDAGSTWHAAQAGPAITDIPGLAIDPLRPDVVYAAAGADGVFRSADRGANWSKLGALPPNQFGETGGNAVSVAIDSSNPDVLYTTTPCSLYKSTDGGATWSNKSIVPTFYCLYASSVSIDPSDPNTLYLAQSDNLDGGSSLQRTTDGGMSWSHLWGSGDFSLWAIAVDPANPSTIYAGTSGGLVKTEDVGVTWKDTGLSSGVSALAIDPVHPHVIYAAAVDYGSGDYSGLFKSSDGGVTWSAINTGLEILSNTGAPITALTFDPANPDVVFAATSGNGIFRSVDGGVHWIPFNEGLGNVDVRFLVTAKGRPDLLYAATYGGVFSVSLRQAISTPRN